MAKNSKYSDELDLIKLINLILNYKVSILIITTLTILIFFAFNIPKHNKKTFNISVDYSILFHPARIVETCISNYKCMNERVSNEVVVLLEDNWDYNIKSQKFTLVSSSPASPDKYLNEFNKINEILTNEIYDTAVNDLNAINEINELIQTDIESGIKYKTNNNSSYEFVIKTKRLIYSIEKNGKKALNIGKINIQEVLINHIPKYLVAFILGIVISILYIIVSSASRRANKQ